MWFKEEPSQFSMVQTAQSLTSSITEKPYTGLDDCPRILLSCFRARNSAYHRNGTDSCLWNAASISPGFGHYVLECLGPNVPSVFLVTLANASDFPQNDTDNVRLLERTRNGNFR